MKLIGLSGKIGSGKTTLQKYLVEKYGYVPLNFADKLKDIVSILFEWDRKLLEGDTEKSREFRTKEDAFWSEKFGNPITPRYILQYVGTEVIRDTLHQKFWSITLEKKILQLLQEGKSVVIADVRFKDELDFVRRLGGEVWRIERECVENNTHPSENALNNETFDRIVKNDGTLENLFETVDSIIKDGED